MYDGVRDFLQNVHYHAPDRRTQNKTSHLFRRSPLLMGLEL